MSPIQSTLAFAPPTLPLDPRQAELACELKALRLDNGIGSKWLRMAIALAHGNVGPRRDFVFEVEYNRLEITPEIEAAWRRAVARALAGEHPEALRQCPCDLCGSPTGSWLHDVCDSCIRRGMEIQMCRRTA